MINDRRKRLSRCARIFVLAIVFIWLTSIAFAKNEVCCMFSSCRFYGFPGHFVSVCKVTESFEEADKVRSQSVFTLISNGWDLHFADDMYDPLPGPAASLLVDATLALAFGWIVDAAYLKLKKPKT